MDTVLFLLHISGLKPLLVFYFPVEEKFAGGKFREIPFAVDIIFAGGKFRAKLMLYSTLISNVIIFFLSFIQTIEANEEYVPS